MVQAAALLELHFYLGTLTAQSLSAVAVQALQEGLDGKALRELAWTHETLSEVGPYWEQLLVDLQIQALPNKAATQRVIQHLARRILAGEVEPLLGAQAFERFDQRWHFFGDDVLGDLTAVGRFKHLFWQAEVLAYGQSAAADYASLDDEICELAREVVMTGLEPALGVADLKTGLEPTLRPSNVPPDVALDPPLAWWQRVLDRWNKL